MPAGPNVLFGVGGAPAESVSGGGRRSPLGGALVVSAALVAVVAEPLWLRALRFTPLDPLA